MLTPRCEEDYLTIRQCLKCGAMNRIENGVCSICGASLADVIQAGKDPEKYGEDPQFPQIVKELSDKLGVTQYPNEAFYKPTYYRYNHRKEVDATYEQTLSSGGKGKPGPPTEAPVDPSYPVIIGKTMLISPLLGGRLQPEEWKPLLTSPLIFYKKLQSARNRGYTWRLGLAILAPILILQAASLLRLNLSQSIIQIMLIAGVLGFTTLIGISAVFFYRRMIFHADAKTAQLLGKDSMLAALNKIESLRQSDKQANIGWPSISITRRIQKLNRQS